MSNISHNIIASSSAGNCIILNKFLVLDLGVPFKKIKPYYKDIKLVFIGHAHSDHLNRTCVKTLARERPTVRFCVGEWLVPTLLECGVEKKNIDIIEAPKVYDYGTFKISPVILYHDIPNYGLRIFIGDEKAVYITDTRTVEGIQAKGYQWYFIESNYEEEDLQRRIEAKKATGEYSYEMNTALRHLSHEQASEFLLENMNPDSEYVFIHQHQNKKKPKEWEYEDT